MNIEKAKRMHKVEMIKAQKKDYKETISFIKKRIHQEEILIVIDFQETVDQLKRDGFIVKQTEPPYKKQYFVSGWAED